MASCLGIYLNSNIVKYAKLTSDSNSNVKVESYGVRFIKESQNETLKNIIEETNSQNIPIVINPQGDKHINYQMFDQVQTTGIAADIAKMEFEAWCEKNAKSPEKYLYVFKNAEEKNEENKFNSVLNFVEKKYIKDYEQIGEYNVSGIYPPQLLMHNLVSKEEKNYMLVDLDSELSLSVVIDGKLKDIRFFDVGMKQILNDFSVKLGSYQRAYEACKQLNVYSDEATSNDKVLESIAEPILQEVLRNIAIIVTRYKTKLDKIFLTGSGIVFTNIDILIKEYIGIKCKILKPESITTTNIRNMAEALETTAAIAIAREMLLQENKTLNFITPKSKLKKEFNSVFSTIKSRVKNSDEKNVTKENGKTRSVVKSSDKKMDKKYDKGMEIGATIVGETSIIIAACSTIVAVIACISYAVFTLVYTTNVNENLKKIETAKQNIEASNATVKSDISYISSSTAKYKQINDQVDDVVEKIENQKIGKFSTYNVASFLQNIIKVIPRNVQLKTITSDDNKNIVITAQSNSYAELGYFVAALKINSTLNNVKINKITNGETTVIEIGGELP